MERDSRTVSGDSGGKQSGNAMTTRSTWNSPLCTGEVRSGAKVAFVAFLAALERMSDETFVLGSFFLAAPCLPPAVLADLAGAARRGASNTGSEAASTAAKSGRICIFTFMRTFYPFCRYVSR